MPHESDEADSYVFNNRRYFGWKTWILLFLQP